MKPFSRRILLQLAAGLPAVAALPTFAQTATQTAAAKSASGKPKTYVLAHGSWHG